MQNRFSILLVVVLAACVTQFASDVYAPSLPSMADTLYADIQQTQLSLAIFLYVVGVSQLVFGALSDCIGRKKPMLFGLTLLLISSLWAAAAHSITEVIFARIFQGIGAGGCAAVWRTIFRDLFNEQEMAEVASYLVVLIMLIIPIAPIVGGLLDTYASFRATFFFMAGYAAIALLGIAFLYPETTPKKHQLNLRASLQRYAEVMGHPRFIGTALSTLISYGAMFSWFVVGPVLVIDNLGLSSAQFGLCSVLSAGIAYGIAGVLNGRLVGRFGVDTMMRTGWCLASLGGFVLLTTEVIGGLSLPGLLSGVSLFTFGITFIWPNANAVAMSPFADKAGTAGALYGALHMDGSGLIGTLMAFLPTENSVWLGGCYLLLPLLAWALYERLVTHAGVPKAA